MLASTDLHKALAIITKDEEMEEHEVCLLISVTNLCVLSCLFCSYHLLFKQFQQNQTNKTLEKKFAYVTVLGWNPDAEQNKVYLDAIRVLIKSLKGSIADFVVLLTYEDQEATSLLQAENAIVKRIDPVQYSLDVPHFETWFVKIALAKLRAFELTTYERVQVLDADSWVKGVDQLDKLFTSFSTAKLVAEGLGGDSPLRAGWLLIRPSETDFKEMQQILTRGVFDKDRGWDCLDLPVEYAGWNSDRKYPGNWEFYGSQLEQGNS
jgi:hypothetical protein